jgi:pimeloyl-ACP methyl ester carboxylesterase
MSTTGVETASEIRPFHVEVPEEELAELRRRILATRWPERETVDDSSQGVQLAMLRELARYWAEDYDFGRLEAKLNALPQFMTEIDGVDVHFIHVKSDHEGALPLIITHGWPGSVIEMLEVIGPLTDPTAHGGSAEDAFDVVVPSLPGYGFSGKPKEVGWDAARIAGAWAELMSRLGYTRYVAQGGDQGAGVTDAMGRQAPEGLLGLHFNFLDATPRELLMAALNIRLAFSMGDRAELSKVVAVFMRGYIAEMGEHPQTIGYPLLDSPLGLAAWMLDHDADSYEKISRAFLDGQPSGNLTRDHVLDNITLYWLTSTAASAARLYWETAKSTSAAIKKPPPHVMLPVGYTVFPGELFQAPRHWVKSAYHDLVYFNEADRGGHFAAWEEPALFSEEMRAAFTSMR